MRVALGESGEPTVTRPSQSALPPGLLVSVVVMGLLSSAVVALTVSAGLALPTVRVGLVAATTAPLFGRSRNSYCPGAAGMLMVHGFEVVPGSVFTDRKSVVEGTRVDLGGRR